MSSRKFLLGPIGAVLMLALSGGLAHATTCTATGFIRDSINLTAAVVVPPGPSADITGTVDATGCNIGIFFGPGTSGTVDSAEVFGANYFGIVVAADISTGSGVTSVDVTNNSVHDIGETPLNGTQHGVGIYYRACAAGSSATGTIAGNTLSNYQKGGIVVNCSGAAASISSNTVTGQGPIPYIAQNGIQVGFGATAQVMRNTVTGNSYTGTNNASSGGILIVGGACYGGALTTGTQIVKNTVGHALGTDGNDVGIWLSNLDSSCSAATTSTNIKVINNTLINTELTDVSGNGFPNPYQAGISDAGANDKLINNNISGVGYTGSGPDMWSIDASGGTKAKVHANSIP